MKSVLKLGFVYTFHLMRSFLLSIVHMNQHWDAPQQQPPPGDPCGPIFPTVTELGAVSRPKICGTESHHQILLPNHKASFGEFLQIISLSDSFQKRSLKKSQTKNFGNVFLHFFKEGEQTPILKLPWKSSNKNQHLTHFCGCLRLQTLWNLQLLLQSSNVF